MSSFWLVLVAGLLILFVAAFAGYRQHSDDLILYLSLIDGRSGNQLWGEQYNRKLTDLAALESEVARDVSQKLRIRLSGAEEQRIAKHQTDNSQAYQLYLKGRYFWNKRNQEGFKKAILYFNQAIELDSSYAQAYAGRADAYALVANYGAVLRKEDYATAEAEARKALAIDDGLAEAHTSLAFILWNENDMAGAEKEFKRAIELNSNYSTAHHWYGNYLTVVGRDAEALAELNRALELDPLSVIINAAIAGHYYHRREYDRAIAQMQKAVELDPNFITGHEMLGSACVKKGSSDEAIAEFQKAVQVSGRWEVVLAKLGYAYALYGKKPEARKILDELKGMRTRRQISATNIALVYVGLGDIDQALSWFEKAHQERDSRLETILFDPLLDDLRNDPRFSNFRQKARITS